MGALNSSSDSETPGPRPVDESGAYEKWLVRILLTLAFGLAFGIEGMTLIRSFLLDTDPATEQSEERQPVLQEGDALAPSAAPALRAHRLQMQATDQEWTFTLVVRPDTVLDRPTTLTFSRLETSNGSTLTTAPRHTWTPSDTSSFAASWSLPVGQRPEALTVTATTEVSADSTVSTTRTLEVGHVPVQRGSN